MLEQQEINPKMSSASKLVLASNDLLGNNKMIIIRHAGEEYRLSITSKDKLILTK